MELNQESSGRTFYLNENFVQSVINFEMYYQIFGRKHSYDLPYIFSFHKVSRVANLSEDW